MTEGSGSKMETPPATDPALDPSPRDPRYLDWMSQNATRLRRAVSGPHFVYWSLAIAFAVGMASYVSGYFLRSLAPKEPFALLADLLYALGWALWTGVVVVLFVEVVPEVKRRQIQRALEDYDAAVAERVRAGNDRRSGGGGSPTAG
jgi:hypothetical protein